MNGHAFRISVSHFAYNSYFNPVRWERCDPASKAPFSMLKTRNSVRLYYAMLLKYGDFKMGQIVTCYIKRSNKPGQTHLYLNNNQILQHGKETFVYSHYLNVITVESHHDDVIKWNHFPRYWPFVRGIHRSPVNSPHKRQWRGALMFSLICAWINSWVNNREAGDLRRHRAHHDVIVMTCIITEFYNMVRRYLRITIS